MLEFFGKICLGVSIVSNQGSNKFIETIWEVKLNNFIYINIILKKILNLKFFFFFNIHLNTGIIILRIQTKKVYAI